MSAGSSASNAAVIALLGPTASGKTAAALAWAKRHPIEIISVDSALVYRGMDIGTAKPTAEEQAQCPHHLIDIMEPTEAYSAARFVADVLRLVPEIRARGRVPVLVGGTMLYAKALMEGLADMPSADPALRARLEQEAQVEGWPAMHQRLAEVDPLTAARLKPNDSQRIGRALEVFLATGRPISAFFAEQNPEVLPVTVLALEPEVRADLHARIEQRFLGMVEAGFLDEMQRLRQRGDLSPELPSMRCVGYRQAWEHLDGVTDFDTFLAKGIAATRQLAKRQLTWLRSMPQRSVIHCYDTNAQSRLNSLLDSILEHP